MIEDRAIYQVSPHLIHRRCGGWLAKTPDGWPLGIGVTGDTKEAAVAEFESALDRWKKIVVDET